MLAGGSVFAASKLLAVDRGCFHPELLHVSDVCHDYEPLLRMVLLLLLPLDSRKTELFLFLFQVLKSSNGESPSNAWGIYAEQQTNHSMIISDYLVHFRPSLGGMSSARAGTGHRPSHLLIVEISLQATIGQLAEIPALRPSHLLMVEISLQATIGQLAEIPALQRAVDQRPCLVATLAIVIDLEARSEND
ncbi:hypothetical protein SAY87_000301 [Trapa incisa]|uniref:Uncharacterized protein n=1 Tax=Trapa incisa TaxID=236973 RepID=A0AAN7JGV4_9MYRT|nr:hypothetical protein SAY87_000301 [Trapa incisa]